MVTPDTAPDTRAEIASEVRAEIARKRLKQTDVAKALNLSPSAISRRLDGTIPFSSTELVTLSTVLDVPVSTFFGQAKAS